METRLPTPMTARVYVNLPEANWLVVWNIFNFSHLLGIIILTDELLFFRGVGSTTNQLNSFIMIEQRSRATLGIIISHWESHCWRIILPRKNLVNQTADRTVLNLFTDVSHNMGEQSMLQHVY